MGSKSRFISQKLNFVRSCYYSSRSVVTSSAHANNVVAKKQLPDNKVNVIKIDKETIVKLEKVSLVKLDNESGIRRLEEAIRFAQKLDDIKIDPSVKPMYSVLENEILELRDDEVTEGNCRDKILENAKLLEDEYFVAPSNIRKDS
uniref:Glutamyl-tRNA(Gln) amidotransferase subunit C, mitochondrial n=1 Tax=Trichogramma kaykai TaxID=54128 RepID=A0ABD2W386_9HYME